MNIFILLVKKQMDPKILLREGGRTQVTISNHR